LDVAVVVDRNLKRRLALPVLEVDAAGDRLVLEVRLRGLVVPDAVAHLAVTAGVAAHDGDGGGARVLLNAVGVGRELDHAVAGRGRGGRGQQERGEEGEEEQETGRHRQVAGASVAGRDRLRRTAPAPNVRPGGLKENGPP